MANLRKSYWLTNELARLVIHKSRPKEVDDDQFTDVAKRMVDLRRRIDVAESEVKSMGMASDQLRTVTSSYQLPPEESLHWEDFKPLDA